MNAIIYKLLFRKDEIWNPKEHIMDRMLRTIREEKFTLKSILFSTFLFHLENKTFPSFKKTLVIPVCIENLNKDDKKGINCSPLSLFHSFIWNHVFLTDSLKQEFLDFFCKIQRTYSGFSRLARIYKCKIANVVVNTDLFLNPLDLKNKRTCVFFIHKSIYYFNISDIWQLLERGWTNHDNFDFELYMPKNPYTNIPFTKHELYSYYFHRKNGGFSIPTLLEYMFQEHFELSTFEIKYEGFISKCMIRKAVFDCPNSKSLYENILEMIEENRYTRLWNIDSDFPREQLIEIMRPYVYVYYLVTYGKLTENQYSHFSFLLYESLHSFWKFNPRFGNKKVKISCSIESTPFHIFEMKPTHGLNGKKCKINSHIISFYDTHLPIQTRHL